MNIQQQIEETRAAVEMMEKYSTCWEMGDERTYEVLKAKLARLTKELEANQE